jgi:hypothetical protein
MEQKPRLLAPRCSNKSNLASSCLATNEIIVFLKKPNEIIVCQGTSDDSHQGKLKLPTENRQLEILAEEKLHNHHAGRLVLGII